VGKIKGNETCKQLRGVGKKEEVGMFVDELGGVALMMEPETCVE